MASGVVIADARWRALRLNFGIKLICSGRSERVDLKSGPLGAVLPEVTSIEPSVMSK